MTGVPSTYCQRYSAKEEYSSQNLQKTTGIFDGCFDLQAIADDAGILHQAMDLFIIVPGDLVRIEVDAKPDDSCRVFSEWSAS